MAYFELKYFVPPHQAQGVLGDLRASFPNSDPFEVGVVDSVYFDTPDLACFRQCADGSWDKVKFRSRRYDSGSYPQVQRKRKLGVEVAKTKWAVSGFDPFDNWAASQTLLQLTGFAQLRATCRIVYRRHRFRTREFRITYDDAIEVHRTRNLCAVREYGRLPYGVLELKASDADAQLPTIGRWGLSRTAFSKYFLSICLLQGQMAIFNKYL